MTPKWLQRDCRDATDEELNTRLARERGRRTPSKMVIEAIRAELARRRDRWNNDTRFRPWEI